MTNSQLWQATLGELELTITKANFSTWFKNTDICSNENGRVIINVPNSFTLEWLEKKYHQAILKTLQKITGNAIKEILYKVDSDRCRQCPPSTQQLTRSIIVEETPQYSQQPTTPVPFGLNKRYIFENFIVGKGNELAHAACLAVIGNPGHTYNPLFIYGGVGLGKTHLLQAIGNALQSKKPGIKVLYATCEKFTNDFIQAVRGGRANEFNAIYRNVDVLLIDDIQFITGKEGTQEAFFHTFNELHTQEKQVVISSDRPPKAIATLEQRLLSRFEWGMIADIQNPDLETRIAILDTKCQERGYHIDNEILNFIANTVQHNIRELEGALNRIIAYHELHNVPLSLENVRSILSAFLAQQPRKNCTIKSLINTVAGFYDLAIEDLLGKSRTKRLALPRQIIMFLMREEMKSSYPLIGQELGGRDHTTAIHAYEKISHAIVDDQQLKQEIELIKERLYAGATN